MNEVVSTYNQPLSFMFLIKTNGTQRIRFYAYDYYDKKKIYCNRYINVRGQGTVYMRLPFSPEKLVIQVFNDKTKNLANMKVAGFKKLELKSKMQISDYPKKVAEFLYFAADISIFLKDLSGNGSTYMSQNANYRIDIHDWLTSDGVKLNTPARITKDEGIIQISQSRLSDFTVYEIFAVLMHEFAHYNLNKRMEDETEADLNALRIYFDLGCPVIDSATVFLKVLKHSNSDENNERLVKIENFINNYTRQYKYEFEN